MATQEDQVFNFIRRFPGHDDDAIARALKISPRQTVNSVCRRLAGKGKIQRETNSNGKIGNYPTSVVTLGVKTNLSKPYVIEPDVEGEVVLKRSRPSLTAEQLVQGGFRRSAEWMLDAQGALKTDHPLPTEKGVYAFVQAGFAVYVGVATKGLKKRLYFYAKPGVTQQTSKRLNAILIAELSKGGSIAIYTAFPPDLNWNDLPVSGIAGLELGLIETFHLPWNIRGV